MNLKINTKRLIYYAFFALIIATLFVVFWFGRVSVETSDSAYEVVVGDQVIKPGSVSKVRPGVHKVITRGPRIVLKEEKVFIFPFFTKKVISEQKEMTDIELVANTIGTDANKIDLYGIEFFENNTWFVAFVGLAGESGDAGPTIAKYRSGKWIVEDGGTGIDYSLNNSLPDSVKKHLLGGD